MNILPFSFKNDLHELLPNALKNILRKKEDTIEIEARLGLILDKTTGSRIDINAKHPIIFSTKNTPFTFCSGVKEGHFNKLIKSFENFPKETSEETVVITNKVRKVYEAGKLKCTMEKIRIITHEIHFPNSEYDVRIAISKETFIKDIGPIKDKKNVIRRDRSRISIPFNKFRFDFTKIDNTNENCYEVELEVTEPCYDNEIFFGCLQNLVI
ncbi:mRNA capping enzyme subunit beta [Tubulinosema ratisbonensis]|uniref:mRNA-capping enzyme subunit beta n=1 Tax=Tubulinosema ratisbonensis TaxID=291195 RepID=A0A437AQ26_9MICR|nr:mRNA capping enzyme subunit beta [Tubulinosema ratisbonensis]